MSKSAERIIWEGPAILTNRIWVSWTGQLFRITFAEEDVVNEDAPVMFRAAVALAPGDAIAFAKLLAESVKPVADAVAHYRETAK